MKAIYKNIALAALALSAVACTQDEDFAPSYLNDPDAVRITAQVASGNVTGGFTRSNPLGTTEAEQKAFNSDDAIAVTAGNQAAVTYTLNGTTWTPEEGKYLKWVDNSMNFTAWYPVAEGTDAQSFTPSYGANASLAELQANDYMTYSDSQSQPDDNSVSIEMERQMVRIVISEINYGNQYNATTNAVESIAITAGSSKYTNGAWDDTNVTAQMYKHTDGDWYAVLPPTATAEPGQTFLTITLATDEILTVKGIPTTAAGQSYDYTLTVGKDKATIGNVKVNPWTDGTAIPGGEAEEVPVINYVWTSGIEASASESVEGEGTEASPYLIHSANDLQWMIDQVNTNGVTGKYFQLTHNLEIDSEEGATWTPIGTADKPFVGNFDGGGCTISGEMHTTTDLVGFFGYNAGAISNLKNTAEVKDCRTLMPASIEYSAIGSIAGYSTGKIIHCENSGNVTAPSIFTTTYTGGICGYQYGEREDVCAFIMECKNSGAVTGVDGDDNATGGIVGQSSRGEGDGYDPVVCASENTGSVTNGQYLGGICGYTNETPMLACRNLGEVEQADGACSGGIVGYAYTEYAGMGISGCYTTIGYVSGDTAKDIEYASYSLYEVDLNDPDFPEWLDYIIGPWNDPNNHGADDEMNYAIVQYNGWYSSYNGCVCNWHWEIGENNLPVLVAGAPLGMIAG